MEENNKLIVHPYVPVKLKWTTFEKMVVNGQEINVRTGTGESDMYACSSWSPPPPPPPETMIEALVQKIGDLL